MEVGSLITAERSRHVFPDGKPRSNMLICPCSIAHLLYNSYGFKEQVASPAFVNTQLFTGHGQVLTRRTEGNDVHRLYLCAVDVRDAPQLLHVGEPRRCYLQRERLDFRTPHRGYTAHHTGQRKAAYAVKQAPQRHASHPSRNTPVSRHPPSTGRCRSHHP